MIKEIVKGKPSSRTEMLIYEPVSKKRPEKMINIFSAWRGLEIIIEDILVQFNIGRESCIEFGVEFGYSTVVLSNFFDKIIGIDTFEGDKHTFYRGGHFDKTKARLSIYENITLIKSDYQNWIPNDTNHYDFAHVDIVHDYKETYECGLWAAQNSDCAIFHDTESFPEVKRAVIDIANATGYRMFNYPFHFGLGILVNPNIMPLD
ncbi:class I SAM-dependent methyltransferase [Lacihabitans lacunae]|uniref:Class I SAM-dependent methyltransferase n=1 Tax=Lacihabitans lacunae TaxID=1028214 RepID=A0ABV7YZM5_9BACT